MDSEEDGSTTDRKVAWPGLGAEYRKVRRRAIVLGVLPCGIGISFAALTAIGAVRHFIGIAQSTGFFVGFVMFLCGLGACAVVYRCPACEKPIWVVDAVFGGLSFDFSAPRCPRCGASFE